MLVCLLASTACTISLEGISLFCQSTTDGSHPVPGFWFKRGGLLFSWSSHSWALPVSAACPSSPQRPGCLLPYSLSCRGLPPLPCGGFLTGECFRLFAPYERSIQKAGLASCLFLHTCPPEATSVASPAPTGAAETVSESVGVEGDLQQPWQF